MVEGATVAHTVVSLARAANSRQTQDPPPRTGGAGSIQYSSRLEKHAPHAQERGQIAGKLRRGSSFAQERKLAIPSPGSPS